MKNFVILNKKEGETPLEALEKFRIKKKIPKSIPMTYAGRLDPMAEGLLLILVGEECKNKEKYLTLGKEYEFQILFGFATDTYDILGKVTHSNILTNIGMKEFKSNIKKELKSFKGKIVQKYPIYSSKTVKGRPLFRYAREESVVEIPEREIYVASLKLEKVYKITSKKLLENIKNRISRLKGDFRQKEILNIWNKNLLKKKEKFFIIDFKIKCSSGTYVRSIANSLGDKLGIPALAFSIKRTKIGKWGKI